jgi:homoserine dehydrogenase
MKHRLAFIGFGTVGQGFAEILLEKKDWLYNKYGFDYNVVAISDPLKGAVYEEEGVDLKTILNYVKEKGKIDEYPRGIKGWDSIKTITSTNANVIIEVSPTDIKTGEPGITHIRTAISNKKHVITTNKGPVALAYHELSHLASTNNVFFKFEGTVLAGTPLLNVGLEALRGIKIYEIKGIMNGTTNYILTQMEEGKSYTEALTVAQKLGYAESDPTADVEGWDVLAKVLILGNVVMGGNLKPKDVEREGIVGISKGDIEEARTQDKRYKLIGRVWREGDGIKAKVGPEKLDTREPLAQVGGVKNAISFFTDDLGEVTIMGPGAGRKETGFALMSDLLGIYKSLCCQC